MTDTEVTDDLIDADVLAKSIDGFEQLAIRRHFREKLETLADDSTMFMRALLFVLERRDRGGKGDAEAYEAVMRLSLETVVGRFKPEDEALDEQDEDAVAQRDREFGEFVVATGLSYTVEQFMALTIGQRGAVLDAAERRGR